MESVINLMKGEGIETLDFFYHKNRPTVQKDGDRYEIMSITLQENDTVEITGIKVYPSYEFKLSYLTVNSRWRSTSVNHIREIIQNEINKLYE